MCQTINGSNRNAIIRANPAKIATIEKSTRMMSIVLPVVIS